MKGSEYIRRSMEPVLLQAAREFPVVVLTGPRQSGKTTLLQTVLGGSHNYISLEPPDVRDTARADPRGFLALYPAPVIFDEVQHVPDLLPYVKELVDQRRGEPGQYILTGSQNLLLVQRITESLAGRAAMLRLLPLSLREAQGHPDAPLPWESGGPCQRPALEAEELWQGMLRGGFPELAANPRRDVHLWHASYVQTYLERDVRSIRQVGDLGQFSLFLRALAARNAQLLNTAELARDLGLTLNTVKAWLSVLEATYQIALIRPYHTNIGKRLVKTPKIYFTDVGTLCYLTGLRDPQHAAQGPLGGALLETAVLGELLKTFLHRGLEPRIHFWRTSAGLEVDFLVETPEAIVPLEVKLSTTPRPRMAAAIQRLRTDLAPRVAPGYVVHPGTALLPLGNGTIALPLSAL